MNTELMPGCKLDISEEEWVDWLLGKLPSGKAAELAAHLPMCSICGEQVEAWISILALDASGKEAEETAGAPVPSDRVRTSLRAHVRRRGWTRRLRSGWTSRSKWAAGIASAAVILVCAAALYASVRQPANQRNAYVASHEPTAISFINAPETASYKVHPYNDELGEGYVWYNVSSGEMLVLLDGLISSHDYDIQAWALSGSRRTNLGLLRQLEKKHAHLYVKAGALENASQLALTIEPSGGSEAPTSPDAFLFRVGR